MIRPAATQFWQKRKYQIGIVAVLLLAAFMRFHRLDSLPPGLHPDEAANGLDIFKIIEHHDFQPFFPANGGREGLFFYLQAIGVLIFGNTIYALRVAPALIGTLAAGAVYLWASSWFGRRTGLIAALLLAVTPWAVTISRDGFRASMVPLVIPLTLWLYTKALQQRKTGWYIAAGASLGIGFYTYIAFRLFPAAIVLALLFALIWRRHLLRAWLPGLVTSLLATAIVLVPLGLYGLHHPDDLVGRTNGVSFTNPDLNHGHPIQTLGSNIVKTALMFNFHGDENYRQNLGGQPELNIFVGVMFVLGIFICCTRLKRLRYFGVLVVFLVMLLPEVLTAEGIPHALRSIGAMPEALVLAAIGISYMLDTWYGIFPLNREARVLGGAAIGLLLALTVYQGYVQYFIAWANAPETYDAYSEDTAALAAYYNTNAFSGDRYAVGGGYGLMPVEFLTHNHAAYRQIETDQAARAELPAHRAVEFAMFEGDRETVLKQLQTRYPKGHVSPHYSSFSGNELFVTYTIPAP